MGIESESELTELEVGFLLDGVPGGAPRSEDKEQWSEDGEGGLRCNSPCWLLVQRDGVPWIHSSSLHFCSKTFLCYLPHGCYMTDNEMV